MKITSNQSTNRFSLAIFATTFILAFAEFSEGCSCAPPLKVQEEFSSSRAVFAGKVLYTDRSLKMKWLELEYGLYRHLPIFKIDYNPRRNGVQVTFEVMKSWKGQKEDIVTLVTGFGTGDCGCPFEVGDLYLLYVEQYSEDWYDVSICSRTQPLKYAAADLAALGTPLKLTQKNIVFHILRSYKLWILFLTILSTGILAFIRFRKSE